ncbi:uncharacterized protein LOC128154686 isoform X1 [Harpia harpyja]|uniref:uncharacterized protein LOC128154686 isoform X1 n=1 Tax=Harpia harpyja TaxID=202280 RepID=UPI0022B13BEE|nr:uncharacterized protein LOC128154686 isoform X1 [Harpia harpyja]
MQVSWDGFLLELLGAGSPAPAARHTPYLLCNPLREPPALGCVVQPRTGGGAGSILPSSSLGPWGGYKAARLAAAWLQPDGTARTPVWRGCVPGRQLCREGERRARFLSQGGLGPPVPLGEGAVRHGWANREEKGSEKGVQKGEVRQKSLSCIAAGGRRTGTWQTWGQGGLTAGSSCSPPPSSPSAGMQRKGRRCQLLAPSLASQPPSETRFSPPSSSQERLPIYSALLPSLPALWVQAGRPHAPATQPCLLFPTCSLVLGGRRPGSCPLLPAGYAGLEEAGTRAAGCANRLRHVPDSPRVAAGFATASPHPTATPASPSKKTRGAAGG